MKNRFQQRIELNNPILIPNCEIDVNQMPTPCPFTESQELEREADVSSSFPKIRR